MRSVVLLVFLILDGISDAYVDNALGVKTCPDDLPYVKVCRRNAVQDLVPLLAVGIPSIGAERADPLENLPTFDWVQEKPGFSIKYQLINPSLSGHSGSIVDDFDADLSTNTLRVLSHSPGQFILQGPYNIEGEIMGVPIKGSGNFKCVMTNAGAEVVYKGHPAAGTDGQVYLQLDSVSVDMNYGRSQYDFSGLFGDFAPLVQAGNIFINSVGAPLLEPELLPALDQWLASIYLQRAQAVFNVVPYDTLFPKSQSPAASYRQFWPYRR